MICKTLSVRTLALIHDILNDVCFWNAECIADFQPLDVAVNQKYADGADAARFELCYVYMSDSLGTSFDTVL